MGWRDSLRWSRSWAFAAVILSAAAAVHADPPAEGPAVPSEAPLPPPPPPPAGVAPGGVVPRGDVSALPPPPPAPPGAVVPPPMCGARPCSPASPLPTSRPRVEPRSEAESRPEVEPRRGTGSRTAPRASAAARSEAEAPVGPVVSGARLRLPGSSSVTPRYEDPTELPRRSKGLLALGITMTSACPLVMAVGLVIRGGGDNTGKDVAVGMIGVVGTVTGIGLTVYGAHRLTPEEMEERRKERRDVLSSALVPAVSVGLGSVEATWKF